MMRDVTECYVVCDGPPGPESGRFVEVEDYAGKSIRAGKWTRRDDGLWAIGPFVLARECARECERLRAALREVRERALRIYYATAEGQMVGIIDAALGDAQLRRQEDEARAILGTPEFRHLQATLLEECRLRDSEARDNLLDAAPRKSVAATEAPLRMVRNPDVCIQCSQCGKDVSTPVPSGTIVRARVEWPECVDAEEARP